MKKLLAIVLSLCMLVVLVAACGGDEPPAPAQEAPAPEAPAAPEPAPEAPAIDIESDFESAIDEDTDEYVRDYSLSGTLRVWYDNEDWFPSLQAAFNELYPNITLDFQRMAHTDARAQMQMDGPAGIGADVFMMPHDHLPNAMLDGLVEPIDPALQKKLEGIQNESAIRTISSGGLMYGVPIVMENIALLYNKDLWGETPPATMEEIIEFAQEYNDPAANKWTMAWQIKDAYHNYHWLSAHGASIFGPNHDDYRNFFGDYDAAVRGVEYMAYLRENLLDVSEVDSNWDGSVARFQNNDLPLTISGPWAVADAKNNGVNFGVTKLPTINGVQPICFSGVRLAVMSSYTEVPELATAYLDFLGSEEGAAYFYGVEGMLPSFADASSVPGLSDDAIIMGFTEQSPYTFPMPVIPEVQAMWQGLEDSFLFVWEKQLTPEEGVATGYETYKIGLEAMGVAVDFD